MNCKQCNTPLGPEKRADAIFCDHNCQQGYFKRKKRIQDKIKKIEQEIEDNYEWIREEQVKLKTIQKPVDLSSQKLKIRKRKTELKKWDKLLKDKVGAFKIQLIKYLDQNMEKFGDDYGYIKFGTPDQQKTVLDKHHKHFSGRLKKARTELKGLEQELRRQAKHNSDLKTTKEEILIRIEKAEKEQIELKEQLSELKEIDVENLPPKFNPKKIAQPIKKQKSLARGLSGDQIRKMKFNTLRLGGELGQFIGELQQEKCAIALTGDSGAGKSTFSYQLAKAFLDQDKSVGYFSLESGITENTQKMIDKFEINSPKFEVYPEGTLEDVRILAMKHDCVIVDSYSKISSKAEDFEALRQDFPNTFFIIIFQKTTDGKIRGGSSILFNSTASIDIKVTSQEHRIAFMKKSRYGSENFVYSITNNEVLKSDTIPIKWSEIEEKWTSPMHD
ncbi:MAG: hypothetical protein HUJ25_17640 [Crocinitomicaceae bacterium]|nr:hypothetical protein [Crocinitomicaceae bacterium]